MLERIIVAVLTNVVSWLFAKGLEKIHGQQVLAGDERSIDDRLAKFKAAYSQAFDGNEISSQQLADLRSAAADFIRGAPTSGGL